MNKQSPATIYLKDYTAPAYLIDQVFLHFELDEAVTVVRSVLAVRSNPASTKKSQPLVLNGEAMKLLSISLDGKQLERDSYQVDKETLTIENPPEAFTLETVVEIKPQENTLLTGLYKSNNTYCTQCESHGFRRITYSLDRPDVMSKFTTTISANKEAYPVLLSNGNLVESRDLDNGRHWVKWEDPSLKPCYLFALVAGDLQHIEDTFITQSKRKVALRVYTESRYLDQCDHAMESLKRAMRWDEETFGREYDLDVYMIVAISDFNMGAMENKGLNIFNTKYVLSKPELATDKDFIAIEEVVGHEYFHNWSGNRVTCRDWFQITLKEGLTVFRDQSFTADLHSKAVKRIHDANVIRSGQFAQDAGPLAHPIQPDSYVEINNFYTVTVYYKGAEVIRMMKTILGEKQFREAMDLYFERHDGQAVTTEEFIKAMENASCIDLTQFRRWYKQAGTPLLMVNSDYDAANKTYTLTVKQSCPATPKQPHKKPFHIPLSVGLLDKKGKDIPLQLDEGKGSAEQTTCVLNITKAEEKFCFTNINEKPIPSLLRNFSAPVKLKYHYSDKELIFLMAHDSDPFSRWDAEQKFAVKLILVLIESYQKGDKLELSPEFIEAINTILNDDSVDKTFRSLMLTLPSIGYLMECVDKIDIEAIWHVREFVKTELATQLKDQWLKHYKSNNTQEAYSFDPDAIGRRDLKNLCLTYLVQLPDLASRELCLQQFKAADNMTDELAALQCLANIDSPERKQALKAFHEKWKDQALAMNKWFSVQALSKLPNTLANVKTLLGHPIFSNKNPNNVHSLIVSFCSSNYMCFHEASGAGYQFLAEQVIAIDSFNHQVAARIIEPLTQWHKFDDNRQELMKQQLENILKKQDLSRDVHELVTKSLAKD